MKKELVYVRLSSTQYYFVGHYIESDTNISEIEKKKLAIEKQLSSERERLYQVNEIYE